MNHRALLVVAATLVAAAASAETPLVSMAADDHGGAVFGFPHGTPNHLRARWLSPGGSFSSQIRVSTTQYPDPLRNEVAVDAEGNASFCWQAGELSWEVAARRMPAAAPGVLPQVALRPPQPDAPAVHAPSPDVASNATGHAVCVWRTPYTASPGERYQVQARILPASGSSGLHRRVSSDANLENAVSTPQVAVAPDGTATVVWFSSDGSRTRVLVRQLAADGSMGSIYAFDSDALHVVTHEPGPQVAVDPQGIATVVWLDRDANSVLRTYARRLLPGGIVTTPRTLSPASWPSSHPSVDVDAAGNAVVVFAASEGPIVLRRWLADGTVGPVQYVASAPNEPFTAVFRPLVAVAPAGEATVTWTKGVGFASYAFGRRVGMDGSFGPSLLLGLGGAEKVDVGATGVATFLFVSDGEIRTRQLDAGGTLGRSLIVAYLN
jgi:hypothetical protein